MVRWVLSLLFWLFVAGTSLLLFPVALLVWVLTVLVDRRLVILHRFTCFWASLYSWLNPLWRVRIEGQEKIRPGVAYVMVANHQSLLDILVLFRLFAHFKWVSKIEIFRIPCVGWNMRLNRYIALRRGDRASVARMMEACARTLREGSSVMIFPEGTRSATGELQRFKPGAFSLALQSGAPLLPIIVEGTSHALPKRGIVLRGRHAICIRVLDEVPYAAFAGMSVEELTASIRSRFVTALGGAGAAADAVSAAG